MSLTAARPEGQASLSPPVTHTHTHTPKRKIRAAENNQECFCLQKCNMNHCICFDVHWACMRTCMCVRGSKSSGLKGMGANEKRWCQTTKIQLKPQNILSDRNCVNLHKPDPSLAEVCVKCLEIPFFSVTEKKRQMKSSLKHYCAFRALFWIWSLHNPKLLTHSEKWWQESLVSSNTVWRFWKGDYLDNAGVPVRRFNTDTKSLSHT